MAYGIALPRTAYETTARLHRSVIGAPETSPGGNLILRVGTENVRDHPAEGWTQTEHVVMTPEEAREFISACVAALSRAAACRRGAGG